MEYKEIQKEKYDGKEVLLTYDELCMIHSALSYRQNDINRLGLCRLTPEEEYRINQIVNRYGALAKRLELISLKMESDRINGG